MPARDPLPGPPRATDDCGCDVFQRGDNVGDWRSGDDLGIRAGAQLRFELDQITCDLRAVLWARPERIGSVDYAGEDDLDRRAQQNDRVEAVVQRTLIRDAACDKQRTAAVFVEQLANSTEVPHRLDPTRRLDVDGPARIVGVDDPMSSGRECRKGARLAGARHAGYQDGRSTHGRGDAAMKAMAQASAADAHGGLMPAAECLHLDRLTLRLLHRLRL
jgi:hypothetical protein